MLYRVLAPTPSAIQRFISRPGTLDSPVDRRPRTAQWEKFVAVDVLAAVASANQVPAAAGVASHQSIAAERAQFHRNRAISPPLTSVTPRIDAPGRSDGGSASILHPNMSDKGRRARRAG